MKGNKIETREALNLKRILALRDNNKIKMQIETYIFCCVNWKKRIKIPRDIKTIILKILDEIVLFVDTYICKKNT